MSKHRNLRIAFALIFFAIGEPVFSQECGTIFNPKDTTELISFGNNDVLEEFRKLRRQSEPANRSNFYNHPHPDYRMPLCYWVHVGNSESQWPLADLATGAAAVANMRNHIQNITDSLNQYFADAGVDIQFYQKCNTQVVHSSPYNEIASSSEGKDLIKNYRKEKTINVHILWGAHVAGSAFLPWAGDDVNLSFLAQTREDLSQGECTTIAHEMGHALGLRHTHENLRSTGGFNGDASNCFQESADITRTQSGLCLWGSGQLKSEVNGDGLKDTPAAPNRANFPFMNTGGCNYLSTPGNALDNWSDPWDRDREPPVRNFMSYVLPRTCRSEFSDLQEEEMITSFVDYTYDYIYENGIYSQSWWTNMHDLLISGNPSSNISYIASNKIGLVDFSSFSEVNLIAANSVMINENVLLQKGLLKTVGIENISCSQVYDDKVVGGYISSRSSNQTVVSLPGQNQDLNSKLLNFLDSVRSVKSPQSPEDFSKNSFIISPNPTNNLLKIQCSLEFGDQAMIMIYDLNGILVMTHTETLNEGFNSIELDVSGLKKGSYLIRMVSASLNSTRHLIKE